MALNPVNPIQSGSATATNGSPTITVTGGVDCSFIVPGFILQIGTRRIVAAVSGTAPVSGTSTITLAANWDQPTTTDVLIGWNSYESLPNIVNRIQNALGQQTAIGELTTNGLIEKTGANAYQTVAITSFGKSLIDDADAAAARTTLGAQAADATLAAIAGVTTAANKIIYFTAADVAAAADLSAYGRTLIATADAAAARTALSAQPLDATLTAVAGVTTAANKFIYFTGVDAAAAADLSAFGRSVIAAADAAAVNTLLGVQTKATADLVAQLFQRATLDLNFATNRHNVYGAFGPELTALTTAVTTARNSTATYQSPIGLATAAINTPRITYDAATGNALGLLAEEQRTNLATYSNDFTNATWTKENSSTIAPAAINSPLGPLTGSAHVSAGTATLTLRQTINAAVGAHCFSVFLKAGELSVIAVQLNDNGTLSNRVSVRINLLTGALSNQETGLGTFSGGLFNVEPFPDGWFRVSASGIPSSLSGTGYQIRMVTIGTVAAGQKYYVAGGQIEAGPAATSYTPTGAAQVTRVADVISRALTTTNANAGAIFIEFDLTSYDKTAGRCPLVKLIDAANTANRGFAVEVNGNVFNSYLRNASSAASVAVTVADTLQPTKAVASFDNATLKLLIAANGVTNEVTMSSAVDMAGLVSHLFFAGASNIAGTFAPHSKTVKRCTYFPRSFTAAEAQAITS